MVVHDDSQSMLRGVYRRFGVGILSVLLLACAVAQRTGFKLAGYALGRTPYLMILLSVVGSIPVNSIAYGYMVFRTGGVLPEYRTWRYFRDYWVIATLNIVNGLGIMWANPFVQGYRQALISSMAIPLTMMLSTICFGTEFSIAAITGVVLILIGVLKVGLGASSSVIPSAVELDGTTSLLWTCVFVVAQIPLSAASVYQEYAFRKSVNMLHYVHYVTLFLLVDLVAIVPMDTTSIGDSTSLQDLVDNTYEFANCLAGHGRPECEGAGVALACYIICMNVNTFVQALLIKSAGATWSMVVVSLGTPLGALAFACPAIVGEAHVESLDPGVYMATVLVTVGTLVYRLGSITEDSKETCVVEADPLDYVALEDNAVSPRGKMKEVCVQTDITVGPEVHRAAQLLDAFTRGEAQGGVPRPVVVAAGVGLFGSEYTNATGNPLSIFDEKTFVEQRTRPTSRASSAERHFVGGSSAVRSRSVD